MELIKCEICSTEIDLDNPSTTIVTDLVNKIVFCTNCGHEIYIPLYLCDPKKNENCQGKEPGGWCQIYCFSTFRKRYAKEPLTIISSKEEYDKIEENIHKLEVNESGKN